MTVGSRCNKQAMTVRACWTALGCWILLRLSQAILHAVDGGYGGEVLKGRARVGSSPATCRDAAGLSRLQPTELRQKACPSISSTLPRSTSSSGWSVLRKLSSKFSPVSWRGWGWTIRPGAGQSGADHVLDFGLRPDRDPPPRGRLRPRWCRPETVRAGLSAVPAAPRTPLTMGPPLPYTVPCRRWGHQCSLFYCLRTAGAPSTSPCSTLSSNTFPKSFSRSGPSTP